MRETSRERAGVSAMTVSRVINESRVSARRPDARRGGDRRARLRPEPARERAHPPVRPARSALIVPDVANPFFTLVVRGAEEVAWRAGYHVILCNTQGDLERERGYLEDMLAFQVEGLLIAPVSDRSRPNLRVLDEERRAVRAHRPFDLRGTTETSCRATASAAPGGWSST